MLQLPARCYEASVILNVRFTYSTEYAYKIPKFSKHQDLKASGKLNGYCACPILARNGTKILEVSARCRRYTGQGALFHMSGFLRCTAKITYCDCLKVVHTKLRFNWNKNRTIVRIKYIRKVRKEPLSRYSPQLIFIQSQSVYPTHSGQH